MNELSGQRLEQTGEAFALHAAWLETGTAVVDRRGVLVGANAELTGWLGVSDVAGQNAGELFGRRHPGWPPLLAGLWRGGESSGSLSLTGGAGEPRPHYRLDFLRHGDLVFLTLKSVLPEASELAEGAWDESLQAPRAHQAMFRRLVRAELQLDSLTRRWPGVIFNQRADFSFNFVSPQIAEITGIPTGQWDRNPQLFWQVLHEADEEEVRTRINQSVLQRRPLSHTFRVRHSQTGRVTYVFEQREPMVISSGIVLGYEGFWIDVTRQTIAERRLSTAAWKETLSVVTMGLAHDFRNLMAGIGALSEQFIHSEVKDHPFRESMELIMNNSRQASQLVQRILTLHHGKTGERNYHDLNELVKELAELTQKVIPRRIHIKTRLHDGSLPVYLDAVEFRQVAINLVINAADAISERGQITIETRLHQTVPEMRHDFGRTPRPPAASLIISDTGCGIQPKHLASLFDAFFTTKELNKGSGLGLYNARLFVEKHHGAITVESELEKGSSFEVWLPLSDFTEGERELALQTQQRRSLLFAGPEGRTAERTVEFLRTAGYHVVVAHSSELAVAMLNSGEYPFAGLYVQTGDFNSSFNELTEYQSRERGRLWKILQIVGCNEDELNTDLLRRVDLVLGADLSQAAIHQKLEELFAQN